MSTTNQSEIETKRERLQYLKSIIQQMDALSDRIETEFGTFEDLKLERSDLDIELWRLENPEKAEAFDKEYEAERQAAADRLIAADVAKLNRIQTFLQENAGKYIVCCTEAGTNGYPMIERIFKMGICTSIVPAGKVQVQTIVDWDGNQIEGIRANTYMYTEDHDLWEDWANMVF